MVERPTRLASSLAPFLLATALVACGQQPEGVTREDLDVLREDISVLEKRITGLEVQRGTFVEPQEDDDAGATEPTVGALIGQEVTLRGEVASVFGSSAFTLDGSNGPLLVVDTSEGGDGFEAGSAVEVTGTVRDEFSPNEVQDQLGGNVDPEALSQFEQQTYVEATQVVPQ